MKRNANINCLILLIFIVVFFSPMVASGETDAVPQSSDNPYSISGTVILLTRGQGLPGATVKIRDLKNNLIASKKTDSSGNFRFDFASTGFSLIWAAKTGYEEFSSPQRPIDFEIEPHIVVSLYMVPASVLTSLPLSEGWNFISLREDPPDNAIEKIVQDISPNLSAVWSYDNAAQQWLKYRPSSANNSLSTIETGKGYWFYMNSASALNTTGWSPPPAFATLPTIQLYNGWNLIGLGSKNNTDLSIALSEISDKWTVIWGWESGVWQAKHITQQTLPVPTLTNLSLDKAYWIRIKSVSNIDWKP